MKIKVSGLFCNLHVKSASKQTSRKPNKAIFHRRRPHFSVSRVMTNTVISSKVKVYRLFTAELSVCQAIEPVMNMHEILNRATYMSD